MTQHYRNLSHIYRNLNHDDRNTMCTALRDFSQMNRWYLLPSSRAARDIARADGYLLLETGGFVNEENVATSQEAETAMKKFAKNWCKGRGF